MSIRSSANGRNKRERCGVALFSTKPYDQTFFQAANGTRRHEMAFFEPYLDLKRWRWRPVVRRSVPLSTVCSTERCWRGQGTRTIPFRMMSASAIIPTYSPSRVTKRLPISCPAISFAASELGSDSGDLHGHEPFHLGNLRPSSQSYLDNALDHHIIACVGEAERYPEIPIDVREELPAHRRNDIMLLFVG